ncbi:uncharacterized protein LOC103361112 [Stegastes partitus]|uniref:Uncharacterized protein LOC103361112 n=1 Tax=Stegastes partitus TaxID=144197 RepID=A0A9Y4MWX2_9TELE|nr:PREDICTED: uncharacterized protein LOC103361112 [Stegastes partitus]
MIDLTDDKGKPDSTCDQESTLEISTSSESSIVFITDGEDEGLPIRENETPIQTPKVATELSEPEYECEQEHPKSTGTMQSSASVCDDKQNESTEHNVAIQMTDRKEGCAQAQLKSADVAKSQMENKGQTQISATADLQTSSSSCTEQETAERGQKRRSSHHTFSPFQKKSKKCKLSVDLSSEHAFHGASKCEKTLVDAVEAQPLSSNVRTVELVLFGSAQQGKCAVIGKRKSHAFPGDETNRPPEVVSVHLSPLKRKSSEAVQRKQSLKQCLHEKWRQSLPPAELWHRNKLKRQKRLSAFVPGVSLKRENSEMRVLHANSKRCRNLKRKRSLSIRLKTGKVKKPNQPDGRERSDTKNGSSKIMPLQENVLKFCVLPKTFDFKDGSHRRKEPTDCAPDKPNHAKEKHQHSSKSHFKVKGSWCPNPEERYKPLCPSPVPKTASVFYEFQKKYVKKVQSSTDKQRD